MRTRRWKRCFKCKVLRPLEEFYAHPQMKDGHLNKCVECAKLDVKFSAAVNRQARSEYERRRFKTAKRKAQIAQAQKRMRERDPAKYKARSAVSNAIRDGKLQRQPCELCGNPKAQAHHEDYAKPLEVTWLCFVCHREVEHRQVTA